MGRRPGGTAGVGSGGNANNGEGRGGGGHGGGHGGIGLSGSNSGGGGGSISSAASGRKGGGGGGRRGPGGGGVGGGGRRGGGGGNRNGRPISSSSSGGKRFECTSNDSVSSNATSFVGTTSGSTSKDDHGDTKNSRVNSNGPNQSQGTASDRQGGGGGGGGGDRDRDAAARKRKKSKKKKKKNTSLASSSSQQSGGGGLGAAATSSSLGQRNTSSHQTQQRLQLPQKKLIIRKIRFVHLEPYGDMIQSLKETTKDKFELGPTLQDATKNDDGSGSSNPNSGGGGGVDIENCEKVNNIGKEKPKVDLGGSGVADPAGTSVDGKKAVAAETSEGPSSASASASSVSGSNGSIPKSLPEYDKKMSDAYDTVQRMILLLRDLCHPGGSQVGVDHPSTSTGGISDAPRGGVVGGAGGSTGGYVIDGKAAGAVVELDETSVTNCLLEWSHPPMSVSPVAKKWTYGMGSNPDGVGRGKEREWANAVVGGANGNSSIAIAAATLASQSLVHGQEEQESLSYPYGQSVVARLLYLVPPRRSRRRGEISGVAYLVLSPPPYRFSPPMTRLNHHAPALVTLSSSSSLSARNGPSVAGHGSKGTTTGGNFSPSPSTVKPAEHSGVATAPNSVHLKNSKRDGYFSGHSDGAGKFVPYSSPPPVDKTKIIALARLAVDNAVTHFRASSRGVVGGSAGVGGSALSSLEIDLAPYQKGFPEPRYDISALIGPSSSSVSSNIPIPEQQQLSSSKRISDPDSKSGFGAGSGSRRGGRFAAGGAGGGGGGQRGYDRYDNTICQTDDYGNFMAHIYGKPPGAAVAAAVAGSGGKDATATTAGGSSEQREKNRSNSSSSMTTTTTTMGATTTTVSADSAGNVNAAPSSASGGANGTITGGTTGQGGEHDGEKGQPVAAVVLHLRQRRADEERQRQQMKLLRSSKKLATATGTSSSSSSLSKKGTGGVGPSGGVSTGTNAGMSSSSSSKGVGTTAILNKRSSGGGSKKLGGAGGGGVGKKSLSSSSISATSNHATVTQLKKREVGSNPKGFDAKAGSGSGASSSAIVSSSSMKEKRKNRRRKKAPNVGNNSNSGVTSSNPSSGSFGGGGGRKEANPTG